jgi:hypothetical protein
MRKVISLIKVNPSVLKGMGYFVLMAFFAAGCSKDVINDQSTVQPPIAAGISETFPSDLANTVAIDPIVSVTFNSGLKSSDLSDAQITLMQDSTHVAGVSKCSGTTTTFTPSTDLEPDKEYTATFKCGQMSNADNDNKGDKSKDKQHSWKFKTGHHRRGNAPTVISVIPLKGATSVAVTILPSATFSEVMKASTIDSTTFTLKQDSTIVKGSVSYSGSTATFTPAANLKAGLVYTATITAGAKNEEGTALKDKYSWRFTTATGGVDQAAPTIISVAPADKAIAVALNSTAIINFSKPMDPLTINATTVTLKQGTIAVTGTVAYSGTTATFTPSASLVANTVYTGTITTGAKDLAGNAITVNKVWSFTTAATAPTPGNLAVVNLGSAGNYVILAKSEITNIATSAITGDMALSPSATSFITGFALVNATGYATSSQVVGKVYAADMAAPTPINLTTAVNNMLTAYTDAAGRPTPDFTELGAGNIGGKTLTPGLYKWSTAVTVPTDVTISGGANDVWIFQISGNLILSSAVKVILSGGAQAKNIFWQVAGQATLGTTSHFEGVILSKTGITLQTGASLNGRALAQTAVILDKNAVTQP